MYGSNLNINMPRLRDDDKAGLPNKLAHSSTSKSHMAKKPTPKKAKATPKKSSTKAKSIASDDLPRKTLEDAIRVARVIEDDYAGKLATWDDIAKSMGFSATNPNNKYFLWSLLLTASLKRRMTSNTE